MLTPSTIQKINTYIDEGVPLEDLFHGENNSSITSIRIAEKVYERLQQDPLLDPVRCLMRTYGRSRSQALADKEIIDLFINKMDSISKQMWMHRIGSLSVREARIAEQTGDWKPLDRAIGHMEKIVAQMDEEEEDKNPFRLPPVFVRVDVLDPSKTYYNEQETQKLTDKYGGHVDPLMQMVNDKATLLLQKKTSTDDDE